MRDHYVGDISDLLKFSLLHALQGKDRRLGIAWYYVGEVDNGLDGTHREWVNETHWKDFDPVVHKWLGEIATSCNRTVAALQNKAFWAETDFHPHDLLKADNKDCLGRCQA
jgi:hypothetical protein